MTRPLNLYGISRIHDPRSFNLAEKHQSQRDSVADTKFHEIESLRILSDAFVREGLSLEDLEGFFYGFTIPQIGKEFDLLKILEKRCINIELKSTAVSKAQIRSQLLKNRHYLNHLGRKLYLYTVVTDSLTCYKLLPNGELAEAEFFELLRLLKANAAGYVTAIDGLFRASDYLVSPFRTPAKFIRGKYFLTQAQEQIKKDMLSRINRVCSSPFFHLTGRPGTGKTLLLYDIAKTLSEHGKTLLLHCGPLCQGQKKINRALEGLTIVPAERLQRSDFSLEEYRYILVDESHRISQAQFTKICASVSRNRQICIFSSDPEQVLSTEEKQRDIVGKICALAPEKEYILSEKIRTNKALQAFIMQMKNLNHTPQQSMDYSGVQLSYANTTGEAQSLLEYYRSKGYVFINYAKPHYPESPYAQYEGDYDTHHVIGQEFDKVVMLMDDTFYYNASGMLQGVPHPNPDYLYPNLFYQGVTRVREALAVVVVNAPELFQKIANIVGK